MLPNKKAGRGSSLNCRDRRVAVVVRELSVTTADKIPGLRKSGLLMERGVRSAVYLS